MLCHAAGHVGTCGKDPVAFCLCTGGSRAIDSPTYLFLGHRHLHTAPLLVPADVEQTTPELPTRMLQLMGLLEREGRTFAQKTLVTLASCNDRGLVFQANCSTTLLEAIRCAPPCLQLAQHAETGVQLCEGNHDAGKGHAAHLLHWVCWQGLPGTSAAACVCCRGIFLGNGCVVHRLAIFDARGCITCIVSQLDIMR